MSTDAQNLQIITRECYAAKVVGIVTESDVLQLTARLLEQLAGEDGADGG